VFLAPVNQCGQNVTDPRLHPVPFATDPTHDAHKPGQNGDRERPSIALSLKDFLHLDATVTVTSEMGSNIGKVTALVREISELLRQGSEAKKSL
jgi:hypothetical protein